MPILHKPFNELLKKYKHKYKCQICGEDADCCLEFHHVNPEDKLFSLKSVNESRYTKEQLITELHKTCILCSNCHRKLHNGFYTNIKLNTL